MWFRRVRRERGPMNYPNFGRGPARATGALRLSTRFPCRAAPRVLSMIHPRAQMRAASLASRLRGAVRRSATALRKVLKRVTTPEEVHHPSADDPVSCPQQGIHGSDAEPVTPGRRPEPRTTRKPTPRNTPGRRSSQDNG